MPGFGALESARTGLFVSERALYVAGHNISNLNTAGYVRQQAIITTAQYCTLDDKTQVGMGADLAEVRQIRHLFIDNVYRRETTTLGYWQTKNKTIEDLESIIGEPMGNGLQEVMNSFWDSWQELSKQPDSLTVRALVRQRGESLVRQVNHMGNQMTNLQDDINSEIKVRLNEVNDITSQIYDLNKTIMSIENTGDKPNDYKDQRNLLLDKLSKLIEIDATELYTGEVSVAVNGYLIVAPDTVRKIVATETPESGLFYLPKLENTDISIIPNNGEIRGLLDSRGLVTSNKSDVSNGSPNTKADVIIGLDVSADSNYLSDLKNNISKYVSELEERGIDYNLRLVTYNDSGILSSQNFEKDSDTLINNIPSTSIGGQSGSFSKNFIDEIKNSTDFRDGAGKYLMLFTNETIDGDNDKIITDNNEIVKSIKEINMNVSVITNPKNYYDSDLGEIGWSKITEETGGQLYDIKTEDFEELMKKMADGTNVGVNSNMGMVSNSGNIIPDYKKRLNALINTIVREVNYLHKTGIRLDGEQGSDFFIPIDSSLPMQMGNIKLNDDISNGLISLNNIATSENGDNGDNSVSLQIANLRHKSTLRDTAGMLNLDEYYQSIILNIGNEGVAANNITVNQEKLVSSSDDYRQSILSVSLDEEMSNIMKFKFAYNANSKVMSTMNEMLDTIINRMGK